MLPSFGSKVAAAYVKSWPDHDVDEALYKRLTPNEDRAVLDKHRSERNWNGMTADYRFADERLSELINRFRARNYADQLGAEDRIRWKTYCRKKHLRTGSSGRSRLEEFDCTLSRLREEHADRSDVLSVLEHLAQYGDEVRRWLGEGT